jgi:NADH:ubiquinone oxidoreductase subunit 3 (subunit A)
LIPIIAGVVGGFLGLLLIILIVLLLSRKKKENKKSENYHNGLELTEQTGNYVMMPSAAVTRPGSYLRPQSGIEIPRKF